MLPPPPINPNNTPIKMDAIYPIISMTFQFVDTKVSKWAKAYSYICYIVTFPISSIIAILAERYFLMTAKKSIPIKAKLTPSKLIKILPFDNTKHSTKAHKHNGYL